MCCVCVCVCVCHDNLHKFDGGRGCESAIADVAIAKGHLRFNGSYSDILTIHSS